MIMQNSGVHLRLRVCTWNVGNAPPPTDLSAWLGTDGAGYDIIAVGAQEANFKDVDGAPSAPPTPGTERELVPGELVCDAPSSTPRKLRKIGRVLLATRQRTPGKSAKPSDELARNRSRDPRRMSEVMNTAGSLESRNTAGSLESRTSLANLQRRSGGSDMSSTPPSLNASDTLRRFGDSDLYSGETAAYSDADTMLFAPRNANGGGSASNPDMRAAAGAPHVARLDARVALLDMGQIGAGDEDVVPVMDSSVFLSDDEPSSQGSLQGSLRQLGCNDDEDGADSEEDVDERGSMSFSPLSETFCEQDNEEELGARRRNFAGTMPPTPSALHSGQLPAPKNAASASETAHVVPRPSAPLVSGAGPSAPTSASKKFSKCVQNSIGREYVLVAKHHLMEIKLLLFVHRKHRSRIGKTESSSEATGIGNVVGNKGAVAVKLVLDDTSFCFVSSHLAAHEGTKYLHHRNTNVIEIMRNLEKGGVTKTSALPSIHQFSHIIWMGDLNYRLDLERGLPKATMMSHEEKWDYVHDAIERRDVKLLTQFDELRGEMANKRVFTNFSEGELTFMPTFKVTRGTPGFAYQRLRIPSYCDRILWHSLPMHKAMIRLVEYNALDGYCTSDHKPVYAVFALEIPRRLRRFGNVVPKNALKCTVDFQSLRLSGLYEKSKDSSPDLNYDVLEDGALSLRLDDALDDSHYAYSNAPSPPTALTSEAPAGPIEEPGATSAGSPSDATSPRRRASRAALLADSGSPATAAEGMGAVVAGGTSHSTHTRRGVRVEFHGKGLFVKNKVFPTDVPLKNGCVRACTYSELPKIPLVPVEELSDLLHKYVTIVFSRWGSKIASSCVLPLADLVLNIGVHRLKTKLELTKFGEPIAYVEVEVELCISMETWIDSRNCQVKVSLMK